MKVIFLDIDGVLALPKQYNVKRNKLYARDPKAKELNIPYPWDEHCIKVLNRFILEHDLHVVLSSDWKLHFNMDEIERIFKWNGVVTSPIGFTKMTNPDLSQLEEYRVNEIQDWIKQNKIETWCAIDDLDLSALGERFVKTDHRMGIGERGIVEKLERALYPVLNQLDHGIIV
jgi:hypothetical protein